MNSGNAGAPRPALANPPSISAPATIGLSAARWNPSYSASSLSELIRQCYAAASAPELWPAFLESITRETGSSSGCLPMFGDTDAGPLQDLSYHVPGELQAEYEQELADLDLAGAYARSRRDFVGTTSELFARHPRLRVPEFETRVGHYGLHERWGATLSADMAIGLHREQRLGVYTRTDTDFLDLLVPHMRAAASIGGRLLGAERLARGLLDQIGQLGTGALLLDARGRVLMVNATADIILRDAMLFTLEDERLRALDPELDERLQRSLTEVIQGRSTSCALQASSSDSTVEVRCSHFRWPEEVSASPFRVAPRHIVFMADADQSVELDLATLRELYGLTPAEVDTLYLLANDCSLAEIADMRGVSKATVRSQLSALSIKTGRHGQSRLTKLALSTTARLNRP